MSKYGTLLIELNTEELPLKKLNFLVKSIVNNFLYEFKKNFFFYSKYNYYYTLRKISCIFKKFCFYQNIYKNKIIYGPSIDIKKKINFLQYPLLNWIKNIGIKNTNKIKFLKLNNKRKFFIEIKRNNKNICFLINEIFNKVLLNIIKNFNTMRWGKENLVFIRPITNIVVMFNKKILKVKFKNFKSNNLLLGHRFIGKNIILNDSNKYIFFLKKYCKIIIDFNVRKNKIISILNYISFKKKVSFNYTELFIDNIVSIIEYPSYIICKFSKNFLNLPKEILILVIEKYNFFPTFDINNNLLNYFIVITNINFIFSDYKLVKKNYELVIESRLFDIKLLYYKDIKFPLISYLSKLRDIIFYDGLGNFLDKIKRMLYLSKKVSIILNKFNDIKINNYLLNIAILLCKCDLATSLCKEYMEMKGIIGMYYSLLNYNDIKLSLIIKNHYFVKYFNNKIFTDKYSAIISLVDKLDTLVGISLLNNSIYLKKKNDPYALRRISLSILNVIILNNLNINLYNLVKFNIYLFKGNKNITLIILKFILKRSINFFLNLGYEKKFINSVINLNIFNFLDIKLRLDSIWQVRNSENFFLFINLIKRIKNILLKNKYILNKDIINYLYLIKKEEVDLYKYIIYLEKKISFIFLNFKYIKLINYFFISINKINFFFNSVRLDIKEQNIKFNRLNLLYRLNNIFLKFVDFNSFI